MGFLGLLTGQGKIVKLFEKAAEALKADKYRKGDLVELPLRGDLILTGDIHGNLDNFEEAVARAALDQHPERHLVLHELIHDFCNRGKDFSYEILQDAARLKIDHPDQVHIILANHELAEYEGMPIQKDGRVIPLVFSEGRMKALGGAGEEIRDAAKIFIKALPVALRTATGVWFSHSTPKQLHQFSLGLLTQPGGSTLSAKGDTSARMQMVKDLVWARDHSPQTAANFAQKVGCETLVVGHEFAVEGLLVPNRHHLILDCTRENACILYMKLDKKYTHRQLVEAVQYLKPSAEFPKAKLEALKKAAVQKLYGAAPPAAPK